MQRTEKNKQTIELIFCHLEITIFSQTMEKLRCRFKSTDDVKAWCVIVICFLLFPASFHSVNDRIETTLHRAATLLPRAVRQPTLLCDASPPPPFRITPATSEEAETRTCSMRQWVRASRLTQNCESRAAVLESWQPCQCSPRHAGTAGHLPDLARANQRSRKSLKSLSVTFFHWKKKLSCSLKQARCCPHCLEVYRRLKLLVSLLLRVLRLNNESGEMAIRL